MEKSSFAPAAPQTTTNSNNLELKAAGCCLKMRTGEQELKLGELPQSDI